MDYKKTHEAALEIGRKLIEKDPKLRPWVESRLPELKKSEDEKMLDIITEALATNAAQEAIEKHGINAIDCVEWLEKKKGNQATTETMVLGGINNAAKQDKALSEWNEDEKIRKELIEFLDELWHLGKNTNFDRWGKSDCAKWIAYLSEKEQRPAEELTIMMDHPLYLEGFEEGFQKGFHTQAVMQSTKPAEWSEEDESFLDSIEEAIHSYYDLNHAPQYDYWLEEKLKSLRSQPKNEQEEIVLHWESGHPEPYQSVLILRHGNVVVEGEWNEETGRWYQYGFQSYLEDNEVDGWMNKKSLLFGNFNLHPHLHPHWKPNEEQMEMLSYVMENRKDHCGDVLCSLYDDLKKL